MSTPTERLEAEVWLEATDPDISVGHRDAFFAAVDDYFVENPTAERGLHFLTTLREDNLAFATILDTVRSHAS